MDKSNLDLQPEGRFECELDDLNIREDEEQGIILEADLEKMKAEALWTALAKVNFLQTFSHSVFLANMKYAWGLAREVSFKAIGENLFVFQFSCLGDWRKVMEEGPWLFRGNVVLLEKYDGVTKPSTVKFKKLAIWARVYDLPTCFRNEKIGHQLGDKIGDTLWVEPDNDVKGWRDYLRIRVNMDIDKPLTRIIFVSFGKEEKREVFRVKYEKLPKFCAICGLIGHTKFECGDGVHDKKAIQYGDWLSASPEKKWKAKGSNSSGSTDTKGSDSWESDQGIHPKKSTESKCEEGSHKDSVGDYDDVQEDARSLMKRGRDQQQMPIRKGASKSLMLGNGEHLNVNMTMATVPVSNQIGNLGGQPRET
jgi:hypothetical protein